MTHYPPLSGAYASHAAVARPALPAPLPPSHFPRAPPLRSLPPPPFPMRSLSDTSTKMTDLSSCRASSTEVDHYPPPHLQERYIPILPRTSSHAHYNKRCETCSASHDGSFGAGRFCSSRCARTVGGLAHRKKRLMERECKQRHAVQKRMSSKRLQTAVDCYKSDRKYDSRLPSNHALPMRAAAPMERMAPIMAPPPHARLGAAPATARAAPQRPAVMAAPAQPASWSHRSPKSVMTITSLLNPSD